VDYKVRVPKSSGDVVHLYEVAWAMAVSVATAHGTDDFHDPAYYGALDKIGRAVLREAKSGRLQVCDQQGFAISMTIANGLASLSDQCLSDDTRRLQAPNLETLRQQHPQAEVEPGQWDFSDLGIDFGEYDKDGVDAYLLSLHTKLHFLNQWGETRGDSFSIDLNAPPWIDERGWRGLQKLGETSDSEETLGVTNVETLGKAATDTAPSTETHSGKQMDDRRDAPEKTASFAGLPIAKTADDAAQRDGETLTEKIKQTATVVTGTEVSTDGPARYEIEQEKGYRRMILENWKSIVLVYGPNATGSQVLRQLKKIHGKDAKLPALKTVQNRLIDLRNEKLIP